MPHSFRESSELGYGVEFEVAHALFSSYDVTPHVGGLSLCAQGRAIPLNPIAPDIGAAVKNQKKAGGNGYGSLCNCL